MSMFFNNKRPLSKSERYYEDEPQANPIKQYIKFPVFVLVALVLVVAVIVTMFALNVHNNSFVMFNKASSKVFDCGSFEYEVTAGVNGTTYMDYQGAMEFDLESQTINSYYHAVYQDYEYDAVTYAKGSQAYRGNYYGGKWTVDNYTDRALDFFDFYRDYRKGDFDASAAVRFTQTNKIFNAVQLEESVNKIADELSKNSNMNNIMHQQISTTDGVTTVTYAPQMDKLFDVIMKYIGSAYTSANAYSEFKADVENSKLNLQSTDVLASYTIDDNGYLTDVNFSYTIEGDTYTINVKLSNFKEAKVEIPESFFIAAGLR